METGGSYINIHKFVAVVKEIGSYVYVRRPCPSTGWVVVIGKIVVRRRRQQPRAALLPPAPVGTATAAT